jgi:Skp family chaperone for outer membrane proteins
MKHWILAALLAICATSAAAQSRTGKVNFANSGTAAAQQDFQVGLAQLHNFQYEEAERLPPGGKGIRSEFCHGLLG